MNKIIKLVSLILFFMLSIYYTDYCINSLRELDPIMNEIKNSSKDYKINAINAIIKDNTIQSGLSGVDIDYKESYSRMKQYGTYNESLTSIKKVEPTISIKDNYDKYVIGGNLNNKNISFVFILNDMDNIYSLLNILDEKNIKTNFFIDGNLIEDNILLIKKISEKHSIDILSYNGEYDKSLIISSKLYLEKIINKNCLFCYSEIDNDKLINICSENKMYTLKPSVVFDKYLYDGIKNNLYNSSIIGIHVTKNIIYELSSTVDYVRGRGYKIVSVNELIRE